MSDLFKVTIDFQTSHLVFPWVIGVILALLGAAILVTRRRSIMAAGTTWSRTWAYMDKPRFLGTIALTVVYFLLMVPVGDQWPNQGLGFLICSIPFVFLAGLLYMHERTARAMLPLAVTSIAVPTLVWYLFTYPFALTLP